MIEIRWHGRGGQGAKTVAQILATALLKTGRHVQAFPEYGPERSGAPMKAYDRVSDRPIRRHCAVTEPDVAVVLDATLLGEVDVTSGLGADGLLLVNTPSGVEAVTERTGHPGPIRTVPGDARAAEAGASHANVVVLGALAAALGEPPRAALHEAVRDVLGAKLSESALDATLAAVDAGYDHALRATDSEDNEASHEVSTI